jgi:hypothetical protein
VHTVLAQLSRDSSGTVSQCALRAQDELVTDEIELRHRAGLTIAEEPVRVDAGEADAPGVHAVSECE